MGLDRDGQPLIIVEDVLFGVFDQGKLVVLGQDDRLCGMTLVTTEGDPLMRASNGVLHRLGY